MNRPFQKSFLTSLVLCLQSIASSAEVPEFTNEGFRVPQPGTRLTFPRDHGSHPEYKIEWWYLTGHLQADQDRRFGFQATFFRFSGPLNENAQNVPGFGRSQLFSTQVALTDIENKAFLFDERLDRDGWDARADVDSLSIRHGPWSLHMPDDQSENLNLVFSIQGKALVELRLTPLKPKVVFGEDGTSRKGQEPEARSYYITFPRLAVSGKLELDGEAHPVTGSAWMDHEIASKQLSENLEGWDWTAIQLEDGREIKAYILRQNDGQPSPFSRLIWIDADEKTDYQVFGESGFSWEKTKSWKSPHTGALYPTRVRLRTSDPETGKLREFNLIPVLEDQEIRGTLNKNHYWEGACSVVDENGIQQGKAYLELAGYATSLAGALK